jgi:hypothetical protein
MTVSEKLEAILSYYAQPGVMSEVGAYAPLLSQLPGEVPALVSTLQGLVLHVFWAERYGVKLSEERQAEVQIRPASLKLARLLEVDSRPLSEARPPEKRLVGNCRDFSLLLAAMLKVHGTPARARCGFGTYFMPGHYEDHWMTEFWRADEARWVQVDAQLDALQQRVLEIDFDPLDMPAGRFVLAGAAWQLCRRGDANPDDFGIFEWKGWDFIKGNVLRDLLSLNKVEVLPWDSWGLTETRAADFTPEQWDQFDHLAALTLAGNDAFDEVRAVYENDSLLHIPADWAR